ncbi:hypothetical protein ABEB36_008170 [Hypothenemus hampei]|uniref:Uncharacterized protein n=1 Tax=Hypothenemus hampei TaxID=57062 RepID=A0ABD1EKZ6_HYPHA
MAIVEAASCGLKVVSTKVGGIPEVLPDDLIILTEPTVPSLMSGLEQAIKDIKEDNFVCPYACNKRIERYYNWQNISSRTEVVYKTVSREGVKTLREILSDHLQSGVWPYLLVVLLAHFILKFYEYWVPRKDIDLAIDYNHKSKLKKDN